MRVWSNCAAFAAALRVLAVDPPARPNVVWLMLDDLGWGEVGAFPADSPHGRIATPELDKFAAQGVRFTHAYAGYTVCAPSRTALFTGRHSGNFEKWGLRGTSLEPFEAVTVASLLRGGGYATAAFGKTAPLADPLSQGFDGFLGQIDQSTAHNMYPPALDEGARPAEAEAGEQGGWNNYPLRGNSGAARPSRAACMADAEVFNYTSDVFSKHAQHWLAERARDVDTPFFLYVSFTVPHAGGWTTDNEESGAPVPSDGDYANRSWPEVERDHAATISRADAEIGALLATLSAADADARTLVFVASDNGAHAEGGHDHTFFDSTGGLRGFKRSLYDGGTRSPTLARWPGVVAAGSVSSAPWAFWDVLPTLCALAGVDAAELPRDLDGESIVPLLLLGDAAAPANGVLFWTWKTDAGLGYAARARNGALKIVVQTCGETDAPSADDQIELYDLAVDHAEQNDVAGAHPDELNTLHQLVLRGNFSCACFQC